MTSSNPVQPCLTPKHVLPDSQRLLRDAHACGIHDRLAAAVVSRDQAMSYGRIPGTRRT